MVLSPHWNFLDFSPWPPPTPQTIPYPCLTRLNPFQSPTGTVIKFCCSSLWFHCRQRYKTAYCIFHDRQWQTAVNLVCSHNTCYFIVHYLWGYLLGQDQSCR